MEHQGGGDLGGGFPLPIVGKRQGSMVGHRGNVSVEVQTAKSPKSLSKIEVETMGSRGLCDLNLGTRARARRFIFVGNHLHSFTEVWTVTTVALQKLQLFLK